MKKINIKILIVIVLALIVLAIFAYKYIEYNKTIKNEGDGKISVVTTLFPTYDFAKNILKDKGRVELILKPGVEPHSFEPTPNDIKKINKSDLFIYTNNEMEPWVEKIAKQASNENVLIVDASKNIKLSESEDVHEDENNNEHEHLLDPHIWTDPIFAKEMAKQIFNNILLVEKNEENIKEYKENLDIYLQELDKLNNDFINMFEENSKNGKNNKNIESGKNTIVFAGHNTFGYFAKRYNLSIVSVYKGFSPNAEPSAKTLSEVIKYIKDNNIKYIYHEELINPKIAKTISDETNVELLILHGLHNLSKEEFSENKTYISLMRENLEKLNKGLKNE